MNRNHQNNRSKVCLHHILKTAFHGLIFFILPMLVIAQADNPEDILKKIGEDVYALKEMTIDVGKGSVTLPCKINMSEGLIEVVLCRKEGKLHESLLVTDVSPLEFQTAMLLLGLDPVNEIPDDESKVDIQSQLATIETSGDSVLLFLSWDVEGTTTKRPLENFIYDQTINREMKPTSWLFRGPVTHKQGFIVLDADVSMIATYHDQMALMELNTTSKFNDELYYVNKDAKLTVGKQVNLIVEKIKK
ncbi:MAG: YdjY domain-containing protein [Bacteroidales bacterium]|nr:YdjY domain-containing protein [Bacteroidales bacterium]